MTGNIIAGLVLGFVIAAITTPVGVSGAVFLLPAQLSLLSVPTPAVTPTNLLFNVVAVPGALLRHRRAGLSSPLTRPLLTGTIPGVILGAVIRVFLIPGPTVFRIVVAAFLLLLGVWLLARRQPSTLRIAAMRGTVAMTSLGAVAGVIGGIYGVGGGSLIAPVLVGAGYAITDAAPAALIATFVTSTAGATTYAVIDASGHQQAGPHWAMGLACGAGGLIGGYLGAALTARLPAVVLRRLLGAIALGLASAYLVAVATHH
jgi:uncharacterized membrane protein YfcA